MKQIHGSLRLDGQLLIVQPARGNQFVELVVDDEILAADTFDEPVFDCYLESTLRALDNVCKAGLFKKINDEVLPGSDMYFTSEYDSVDDYESDQIDFCEDKDNFLQLTARLREADATQSASVRLLVREQQILLSAIEGSDNQ